MKFDGEASGPGNGFVHEALIYGSEQEFMDVAFPFVTEGISSDEPTLVAVQDRHVENLRAALGGTPSGVTLYAVEQWYETSARTREKFARWAAEHAVLRAAVRSNLDGPLLVAGDLNAVHDHGPIRALVRDGLTSATDIVGAGWLPTYPANRAFPPLLPIDHVMVNDRLTATSISTVKISRTDHLGLIATIAGTG